MTNQQKLILGLIHTLSQNCGICYDNYLYDHGRVCEEYEKIQAIVPNGIEDPDIPTGIG